MTTRDNTPARGPRRMRTAALRAVAIGLTLSAATGIARADALYENEGRVIEETLYGLDDAIYGVRIGWHFDVLAAYEEAIETGRPLVLVYGTDWCHFCWTLVDEALTCPSVNRFSGYAVFAYADPDRDEVAAMLGEKLEIDAYPTISVLAPTMESIDEDMRINGVLAGDEVAYHFARVFDIVGYARPSADAPPAPLPFTPLALSPVDEEACHAEVSP